MSDLDPGKLWRACVNVVFHWLGGAGPTCRNVTLPVYDSYCSVQLARNDMAVGSYVSMRVIPYGGQVVTVLGRSVDKHTLWPILGFPAAPVKSLKLSDF